MSKPTVIVTSKQSFELTSASVQRNVVAHGFGVLHVHDVKATLAKKGTE